MKKWFGITIGIVSMSMSAISAAQPTQEGWDSYSCKFICGSRNSDAFAATQGVYRSICNIHNPHYRDARVYKKVVRARTMRSGVYGAITPIVPISLNGPVIPPDAMMGIDCEDVYQSFDDAGVAVPGFVEGYVVFLTPPESRPDGSLRPLELDVDGIYTVRGRNQTADPDVKSIHVQHYDPINVDGQPPIDGVQPDLTISLINPPTSVSCPTGQGSCVHIVDVQISNIGGNVSVAYDVQIDLSNGDQASLSEGPLAPGASITRSIQVGPGNNCYAPNCKATATVDSTNTNVESDESNNTDTRTDQG